MYSETRGMGAVNPNRSRRQAPGPHQETGAAQRPQEDERGRRRRRFRMFIVSPPAPSSTALRMGARVGGPGRRVVS